MEGGLMGEIRETPVGEVPKEESVILIPEEKKIKDAEMYEKKEAYVEAAHAYISLKMFEKAAGMYLKAAENHNEELLQRERYYESAGMNFEKIGKFIDAGDAYLKSYSFADAERVYKRVNYTEGIRNAEKAGMRYFEGRARN